MAELLPELRAIVREAGALALQRSQSGFRRWDKSPGNPVSEVDLEVDALLRTRLGALLPDAGWLSEETADNDARLACERIWVVDPIDGTRDFVRGRSGWAVSVALVEQEIMVMPESRPAERLVEVRSERTKPPGNSFKSKNYCLTYSSFKNKSLTFQQTR